MAHRTPPPEAASDASPGPQLLRPTGRDTGAAAWFFGALALLVLAASLPALFLGPAAWIGLVYERGALSDGELWRLLTAHFVHLTAPHLLGNLVGLGTIALLFGSELRPSQWTLVALLTGLACGIGLWVLNPQVLAMAGLSGLLHGLLAAGALAAMMRGQKAAWLVLGLLLVKLGGEQAGGPLPWSTGLPGGVAIDAHLYGALSGGMLGALLARRRQVR